MSERDGYAHGVPCWIDTWREDTTAAGAFYGELLGWEIATEPPLPGAPVRYDLCRLRGRDIAAIGSRLPPATLAEPAWTTYVWVDDADATAAKVREAGGRLPAEPFDSLDGGRIAIAADPAGAVFGIWRVGEHKGAQLVNEPGVWAMSALMTPDPDGAAAFYGAVFGWTTEAFGPATMFRLPGYVGGEPEQPVSREVVATMVAAGGDTSPHWRADLWVRGLDAVAETAARLGGMVIEPPADVIPGKMRGAVLADPEGAVFSTSELLLPG